MAQGLEVDLSWLSRLRAGSVNRALMTLPRHLPGSTMGWTMAELTPLVVSVNQPDGTLAHLDCSPMPCCTLGSDGTMVRLLWGTWQEMDSRLDCGTFLEAVTSEERGRDC